MTAQVNSFGRGLSSGGFSGIVFEIHELADHGV